MTRQTMERPEQSIFGYRIAYTADGHQRKMNAFFEDLEDIIRFGGHYPLERLLERLDTNWPALERRLYHHGRGDLVRKILDGDQRGYPACGVLHSRDGRDDQAQRMWRGLQASRRWGAGFGK